MPQRGLDWRVEVLGTPRLVSATSPERAVPLERKTAALLAYLALEGRASRALLAELLWPDTPSGAARNNLVHVLRRLKEASGVDLVEAGEVLSLGADVRVDVLDVLSSGGEHVEGGGLLDGAALDDLPDFSEWLLAKREELDVVRTRMRQETVEALLARGETSEAVELAERWMDADPLAEDAHRALMRAHYDLGDRPAALRAYHRCKMLLRRELGVDPSPETQRLARAIDLGTVESAAAPRPRRIPLTVLRPPTLVGREDVWARMEEAWAKGLGIVIEGDPGSGKSRLARDFLRSREGYQILFFQGRPGDADVPYATHARNYRQTLEANPDLELPEWVIAELARMLPELGEAPPPLQTELDKRRFYEAKYEVLRRVAERGPVVICTDDVQFMDEPSIEAGAYVGSRFWGDPSTTLRALYTYRTGALPPYGASLVAQMTAAGVIVPMHLTPLSEQAVTTLLADLDVPDATHRTKIARTTRGNVQFVLETVKNLFEDSTVAESPTSKSDDITAMVEQRLARLSPSALQAARAAAVLRLDFTLELVSQTLGIGLLETATAWEELEDAQVVSGEAFSHDLVQESVLTTMPPGVRRILHRSAARVLMTQGAPPARIAGHWQAGEDPRQAARWLVQAGEAAQRALRLGEAHEAYTRALAAALETGDESTAASAREALAILAARVEQAS
ncbi:ATP-binding protein [Deinococcus yavapaiensis]|nr:BTAD domain-containing putative transcriptional regulator [Deinococcus yavapaiensis]